MLENFLKYTRELELFNLQDSILLAMSGGLDSMVMADLFIRAGIDLGLAHCNFKLRGKESDRDEQFVMDFASQKNIPCYTKAFDTKKIADNNTMSIQMVARQLRMDWLEKLSSEKAYQFYATAHHLDDQNETFFINLLRGSGIAGFHGIKPRSGKLIHPMLFAGREEIQTYALDNNIIFREDSSNQKTNYRRNKIRHHILPELEKIQPGFKQILSGNILKLQSAEKIYRRHIDEVRKQVLEEKKELARIHIKKVLDLAEPETYLFELLYPYGYNSSDINQIFKSLAGLSGKLFFSQNFKLVVDREYLLITPIKSNNQNREEYFITKEMNTLSHPVNLHLKYLTKSNSFRIRTDSNTAQLDSEKLKFPLQIRKWRTGDFFYPLGMKGKKKVSDFFIDEKLSRIEKDNCWLLISGQDIIWIIGYRLDDRYKITNLTTTFLEVEHFPD